MFFKSLLALSLLALSAPSLAAPAELVPVPAEPVPERRDTGWTTCDLNWGLSSKDGLISILEGLNARGDTPFAVNPGTWATVTCDPALIVCIQVYNADKNNVLQTNIKAVANLVSQVLYVCTNGDTVGGEASPDGNSWVVQVRGTRFVCSD